HVLERAPETQDGEASRDRTVARRDGGERRRIEPGTGDRSSGSEPRSGGFPAAEPEGPPGGVPGPPRPDAALLYPPLREGAQIPGDRGRDEDLHRDREGTPAPSPQAAHRSAGYGEARLGERELVSDDIADREHPVAEKLAAYLADELSPQENDAIQEHVASCALCAERLLDLQRFLEYAPDSSRVGVADLETAAEWRKLRERIAGK